MKIFASAIDIFKIYTVSIDLSRPKPDKPEPKRFEDKKIDHESTKIRRHESLKAVLFRAFNLSCFRDCVSEFSARKNAKIITKVLMPAVGAKLNNRQ
jgi:hypothetical protein